MRKTITLGRLTSIVRDGAMWIGQDDWPSDQLWADEIEHVLQHLECHDKFADFLPRLRGDNRQRNSTMAEARVAYWFCRNGFKITAWEPKVTNQPGDLEVRWGQTVPIFVEIKQPTWEGELSDEEIAAGRKDLPRFIHAEARSFDSDAQVAYAANKSLGKLSADQPNLVVVAENTFVSPVDGTDQEKIESWLQDPKFDLIGAVLCIDAVLFSSEIEYRTIFVENPRAAGQAWQIPGPVADGLSKGNWKRRRR